VPDTAPPHAMAQATHDMPARWQVPGLEVQDSRAWGPVAVSVFRRAEGESVWRCDDRHRLTFALKPIGPAMAQAEGGRPQRGVCGAELLFLVPAGVKARFVQGPCAFVQLLLDPGLLGAAAREMPGGGAPALEFGPGFYDPLIAEIVRALARETGGGPADRLLVDGLSTALAVQLLRRLASWTPPVPHASGLPRERLRRVLDHIEAHLGEPLGLADLAAVAGLSPWHFSRCFAQAMGVGPHRYVTRRRIARAQEMMRATREPIAAIAQALGFADQSHFTSAFRRETGATPARFRAALA
jgi:AraC family transcriptional regulator